LRQSDGTKFALGDDCAAALVLGECACRKVSGPLRCWNRRAVDALESRNKFLLCHLHQSDQSALGFGSDTHLAVLIGVELRKELRELLVGDPRVSQSFVQLVAAKLACNEN